MNLYDKDWNRGIKSRFKDFRVAFLSELNLLELWTPKHFYIVGQVIESYIKLKT
jgi:hypothetical protein